MVFLAFMFFTCGFALGINSLLVPVLKVSLSVSSMEAYMLIGATFLPFLIFGYPAGLLISKIGYKRTMASAFAMFAIAFGVFILSAEAKSFVIFLLASFICGMANTFLQAAINPYVTILGPTESAAKRISIMGMINKLAWPVSPLFIALFCQQWRQCRSGRPQQTLPCDHRTLRDLRYCRTRITTARSEGCRRRQ